MAPSRFSSLRFTSVGVFPDLLRILIGFLFLVEKILLSMTFNT